MKKVLISFDDNSIPLANVLELRSRLFRMDYRVKDSFSNDFFITTSDVSKEITQLEEEVAKYPGLSYDIKVED